MNFKAISSFVVLAVLATAAVAQEETHHASPGAGGAPSSLTVFFKSGSSSINPKQRAVLDQASRTYNEGRPIVMIIAGSSDRSGDSKANLILSQRRATAVLQGLLDRGIPAERFQVLAKGETEPAVPTAHGVPDQRNRRVVISWH